MSLLIAKLNRGCISWENNVLSVRETREGGQYSPGTEKDAGDIEVYYDDKTRLYSVIARVRNCEFVTTDRNYEKNRDILYGTTDRKAFDRFTDDEVIEFIDRYGWPFFRKSRTMYKVKAGWLRLKNLDRIRVSSPQLFLRKFEEVDAPATVQN